VHITCPGCSTRYTLPPHLIGPAGARVCCPACSLTFVLGPAGDVTAVIGHAAERDPRSPSDAPAPRQPRVNGDAPADDAAFAPQSPPSIARDVLIELDDPPGTLAAAAAAGRLFTDHGPALLAAYEALARELPDADVGAAFRIALVERTGVDLPAPSPAAPPASDSEH